MQQHSTKVFQQICEALGVFIQSLFAKEAAQILSSSTPTTSQNSGSNSVPSSPSTEGSVQSGFLYKGAWIPVPSINQSISKSL